MATVVKVPDEGEPITGSSKPEGSILNEPRYISQDKRKGVDRDPKQHEFLWRMASSEPAAMHKEPVKRKVKHSKSQAEGVKFKGEASLIPEGAWFNGGRARRATTPLTEELDDGGSSSSLSLSLSSSSSSLSSLSSSSSSVHGHTVSASRKKANTKSRRQWQKGQRQIRRAMRGVKINMPEPWDSRADFDRFDEFIYEFDNWLELTALLENLALGRR
jgi:hypothetical protein